MLLWEPCRISDIKAYRPENTSMVDGFPNMLMEQGIWTGRLRQQVYYSKRQEEQEKVKKIDEYNKQLIVENQREIPMTEIVEIVIV